MAGKAKARVEAEASFKKVKKVELVVIADSKSLYGVN